MLSSSLEDFPQLRLVWDNIHIHGIIIGSPRWVQGYLRINFEFVLSFCAAYFTYHWTREVQYKKDFEAYFSPYFGWNTALKWLQQLWDVRQCLVDGTYSRRVEIAYRVPNSSILYLVYIMKLRIHKSNLQYISSFSHIFLKYPLSVPLCSIMFPCFICLISLWATYYHFNCWEERGNTFDMIIFCCALEVCCWGLYWEVWGIILVFDGSFFWFMSG